MAETGGMLSLSWNNHASTFTHMLASLRRLERFTDVTLSCDGEFYCVHKFVLSMCSEYFTKMFERTPCSHPVVVLKDIHKKEIEALLNYMYLGQVSVSQHDLPHLIKAAEVLQVKGLAVPEEVIKGRKGRLIDDKGQWKYGKKEGKDGDLSHMEIKPGTEIKHQAEHSIFGHGSGSHVMNEHSQGTVDTTEDMEEGANHSGLIRIGACFHSKENTGLNVSDLVDQNMELGREGNAEGNRAGNYPYNRDGRTQTGGGDQNHPQLQELYSRSSEGDCSGGNTDGNALSVSRFKYDKMYPNRTFYQTLAQENTITEGQPGPSLLQSGNDMANRTVEGSVTVEGMQNFSEETFQNPYFLFSSSDPNDCLSPKFRNIEKRKQRPYACTQCSYCTSSRSNLVIHMRTHTGERPYSCPECSFSASFEYNLKVHMRIHTGEKPFVCPHCPVKFAQKSHLKNHMVTHTGEKPYVCHQCSMRFSRKSNLHRHLAKHQ